MSDWFGKIIYDREGIDMFKRCDSKAEAQSYVDGFNYAKDLCKNYDGDLDPLEDYWTAVDQIEPLDEDEPPRTLKDEQK